MSAPRAGHDPLDERDKELVRAVDDEMARAIACAGRLYGCGPGRADCCQGPFPINLLDARRLQRGLEALSANDPARAQAVQERARAACARHAADFPGHAATGLLGGDDAAEEAFSRRHAAEPCPALDPATRRCDLYEWRPLACRTMGPPVRLGGVDLPPCPFCFAEASYAETERCRATPDPGGREDALVEELERRLHLHGETIIAFALAGRPEAATRR